MVIAAVLIAAAAAAAAVPAAATAAVRHDAAGVQLAVWSGALHPPDASPDAADADADAAAGQHGPHGEQLLATAVYRPLRNGGRYALPTTHVMLGDAR